MPAARGGHVPARTGPRLPAASLLQPRALAALLLACAALAGQAPADAQPAAGKAATPAASAPAAPVPSSNPVRPLGEAQLAAALRAGGLVVYFRHTATDFSRDDANMVAFDDCANQRPLSEAGRAQARAIGAQWRRLNLPVARVLASPYCRTLETARLIFPQVKVEPADAARGGPIVESGERYAELKALFATPLPPGGNLVIASHGNPFQALAGSPYLREGEAAVLRPLGSGRWEVVARVLSEDWARLR
jgi:hypothetical protein